MLSDRQTVSLVGSGQVYVPPTFAHTEPLGKPAAPEYLGATLTAFTAVAATNLLTSTAHGLTAGMRRRVSNSGGALPAGLAVDTDYFVIASGLTANDFKLSAAPGGTEIDITSAGTGTHSFYEYYSSEETAQIEAWLATQNGTFPAGHAWPTLPAAIGKVREYQAYYRSPAYMTWWHDNNMAREARWLQRRVDISQAVDATVPRSADPTGAGSGAATSPVATTPSQCDEVTPEIATGTIGGTITLQLTCATPGSTIHYRRPSGSGSWHIYAAPVGMTAGQVIEFYATASGSLDSNTIEFDNS